MKIKILRKIGVMLVISSLLILTITSVIGNNEPNIYGVTDQNNIDGNNNEANIDYNDKQIVTYSEVLFEKIITFLIKLANIPSVSTAIVRDNQCTWSDGFGLYDIENNKDARDVTMYLVASISKSFTATAIMQLYEKGLFELDDDVNNYLPFSLRNPNYPDEKITFEMLLAHQSSIAQDSPTFFTTLLPGCLEIIGYPDPFLNDYLVPDGIYYNSQVWNEYLPGEKMYYANIGYALLGYLVEILSGQPFEEYCYENIFEPLGMENTSFKLNNLNVSNVAVPYEVINGKFYPYLHYSILDYPAGGLRTNVRDLSHFLIAISNYGVYEETRILEEDSIEEMQQIHYPSDTYNFQYGLGFQIWVKSTDTKIGHTGGLFGVTTKMVFRESDNIGVIFFINKYISNARDMIAYSLIEQLLFWKASGFESADLQKSSIIDTIKSNQHLTIKHNFQNNLLFKML